MRRRGHIFYSRIVLVLICLVMCLWSNLYAIGGSITEAEKSSLEVSARKSYIKRCNILDRNQKLLQESNVSEDGGVQTQTADEYAHAHSIGYCSDTYGSYGLLKNIGERLYMDEDGDGIGDDLLLTIDSSVQSYVYQRIQNIAQTELATGIGVFVMKPNGEVLVNTAYPSFSCDAVSDLSKASDYMNEEMAQKGDSFLNTNLQMTEPGSSFKIFDYAVIDELGYRDEVYRDTGKINTGGFLLHNDSGAVYGDVTLDYALKKSVNTYFCHYMMKAGKYHISSYATAILGEESIGTDFGNIKGQYHFLIKEDTVSEWELAIGQNAIGQGGVLVSPAANAVMLNGLLTGKKVLPFEVQGTQPVDLWNGNPPVSDQTRKDLKNALLKTADGYRIKNAVSGYQVLAKTGTASKGDGTTNAWIVSGLVKNGELKCVVVVMKAGTKEYGKSNRELLIDVYKKLVSSGACL
ncbi:MAG: hypothetical protein IKV59_03040 [Lachnospiraceae bacterium]|nr:hypothetical protein [Lachnospiraceae bacterium]